MAIRARVARSVGTGGGAAHEHGTPGVGVDFAGTNLTIRRWLNLRPVCETLLPSRSGPRPGISWGL